MALSSTHRGAVYGLTAALLFGASTPFAKRMLDDASPQLLAGLLYLGAFVALCAVAPLRRRSSEAPLRRADLPRLAGITAAGGVVAPVLLLVGLERVSGSTTSLLLNLEGPFTLLLGLVVFREHLGKRSALGATAVFAAAAMLTVDARAGDGTAAGVACIVLACALWGLDNNLTQSLTTRDPFSIVRVKSGVAAGVNLTLAFAVGTPTPGASVLLAALLLGALSYGLSIVFDAYALRALGAAREAAIFATAPFAGAALAAPVLSEPIRGADLIAGATMALGIALLLTERHSHAHTHEPLVHDHVHVHDEHHRHEHAGPVEEPHSHPHRHEPLTHAHPHVSDVHHRHPH